MIGDARNVLAAAVAGVGVPVHPYPPATVPPPALVIIPGSTYLNGYTLKGAVTFGLVILAVTLDSNPQALDELIWDTRAAVIAAGWAVGPIPAPTTDTANGILIARIPVTLEWM